MPIPDVPSTRHAHAGRGTMEENNIATGNEENNYCTIRALFSVSPISRYAVHWTMNNVMPLGCQQDDTEPQSGKENISTCWYFKNHALTYSRQKMPRPSNLHKLHFHNLLLTAPFTSFEARPCPAVCWRAEGTSPGPRAVCGWPRRRKGR